MTEKKRALVKRSDKTLVAPRDVLELGQVLASSGYFADTREAAQAVVKILAGQEMGFGPISSMTGIFIVKGRVTPSANLIAAAIKRSKRHDFRVAELTNDRCEITFYTDDNKAGISEFSIEDAKVAGLLHGDNWQKYPRNMLFARALLNGARWFCPDTMNGELPLEMAEELVPIDEIAGEEEPESEPVSEPEAETRRITAPPEGFQPNWTGFWGEMRELLGEGCRSKVHAYFGVADENGALKAHAEQRAEQEKKPLAQVIGEMRGEVRNAERIAEDQTQEDAG